MKQKSVILDIFHGHRGQIDEMKMPPEYLRQSKEVCQIDSELKEKLSPELRQLQENLMDLLEQETGIGIDFFFAEGFKLGLLVGVECKEE